jgi:hypothetical protein
MFKIIHELENLTEVEREQYAADASVYFGLEPGLGGLDFIWMNHESGFRKLVLYARRGITDILRDKHGISVTQVLQASINGSLATTATGRDVNGRQEIAVGSHWIEGLVGKSLDDAIMTSQTRALRRLTLQFVGGGILDESELGNVAIRTTQEAAPVPTLPSVAPNPAPGKDVTVCPNRETKEAFIARLNAEEPKSKKPPRRSKTTVDMGPSEPPPRSAKTSANDPAIQPAIPAEILEKVHSFPELTPEIEPAKQLDISPAKTKLDPEVAKPYRERLYNLVRRLELEGGFKASMGVSNPTKMNWLLSIVLAPDVITDGFKYLTVEQWEKFLSHVEGYNVDPTITVGYIHKAIGLAA